MKHIKKKYQVQQSLDLPPDSPLLTIYQDIFNQEILKANYNKRNLLIQTSDNEVYLGFIYNNSGTYVPIALPDFTLVYYDFAYNLNVNRQKIKRELLSKISSKETMSEDRSKELYEFYGISTSCIISLFTSIESFINHLLPDDRHYEVKQKNRTEIYNREQIQLHITFMDKLKFVLPFYYGKSFFSAPTQANTLLQNLKELRDNLIHTKSDTTYETHIEIFKKLLNFKYDEAFGAISLLYNFYKPGYLESCPCDNEY